MHAEYAASFGSSKTMHAIRGEWSYSAITHAMTVCGRHGPFNVNHHMRSDVEITCKTCIRLSPVPEAEPVKPKLTTIPTLIPAKRSKTSVPDNARYRRLTRNGADRYSLSAVNS